jgi:16S rRNA (cytosine967-C5)-methyltransferase
MKLYKNLVNAVALTLQEIIRDKRYADKALERQFKQHPQWGSRDRRFIAEGVYDAVRYYRLYAHLAQSENNFWFITAVWLIVKGHELPDWQEFVHVNREAIKKEYERSAQVFALAESYPDWLITRAEEELGEELAKNELRAMNIQAPVFLRVNTLLCTMQQCLSELEKSGIAVERVPNTDCALRLLKRENIFTQTVFKKGWIEVQDAGSQLISEFVNPLPGQTIIDACAGAGGKSLHLAALMNNKGKIISLDVEDWKLEELKKRAKRANAQNIETQKIELPKTLDVLSQRADKILLDVPCSGTGVFRRNPDAKWKLSNEVIEKTRGIQKEIISTYHKMLKPGGELIYSTCSILPSENENTVQAFLAQNPAFELVEEKHIFPSAGFDGFYMAKLKKALT